MAISIKGSVGRRGDNRPPDTTKIQKALKERFPALGLDARGECGPRTIKRIERFQASFMREPDGRVDPGGKTLRMLNTAIPSIQPEWSGNSANWAQPKKLASLDAEMRPGWR